MTIFHKKKRKRQCKKFISLLFSADFWWRGRHLNSYFDKQRTRSHNKTFNLLSDQTVEGTGSITLCPRRSLLFIKLCHTGESAAILGLQQGFIFPLNFPEIKCLFLSGFSQSSHSYTHTQAVAGRTTLVWCLGWSYWLPR